MTLFNRNQNTQRSKLKWSKTIKQSSKLKWSKNMLFHGTSNIFLIWWPVSTSLWASSESKKEKHWWTKGFIFPFSFPIAGYVIVIRGWTNTVWPPRAYEWYVCIWCCMSMHIIPLVPLPSLPNTDLHENKPCYLYIEPFIREKEDS